MKAIWDCSCPSPESCNEYHCGYYGDYYSCIACEIWHETTYALETLLKHIDCWCFGHSAKEQDHTIFEGVEYTWVACRKCGEVLSGQVPPWDIVEILKHYYSYAKFIEPLMKQTSPFYDYIKQKAR